mgnify:CR=1 FL=1
MIVGLGTDIVSIERIKSVLDKNGSAFIERICSGEEKKYLAATTDIALKAAKLWAVKEAAAKALGTGFAQGVTMKDIELKHNLQGRPFLEIKGKAQELLQELLDNNKGNIQVSLSDDRPWAQAVVIIEKI